MFKLIIKKKNLIKINYGHARNKKNPVVILPNPEFPNSISSTENSFCKYFLVLVHFFQFQYSKNVKYVFTKGL